MKSQIANEVDVLIVGGGPIGLATAIQLRTHGIENIRIIDKSVPPSLDQLTDFSRAIGVHARTLEILEDIGISPELISRGTIAHTGSYYYKVHMMYRLGYALGCDKAHLRYPWNLMVTQGNTIDVLKNKLIELGQEVEWETSLTEFESTSEYVTATILNERTGETETIRSKWLLGCDGAHSIVRKKLNIDFPGHAYSERWVVCDLNIEWDIPHDDIAFLGSKDAFAVTLPLAGWGDNRYRVTMIQPLEKDDPSHSIGHAIPMDERRFTRAECEAFFQKIYPTAKVHCPDEAGNWFMVHCRLADRYRAGRCFLLGDAAHIHSPILGQGMNMGIQDATNLAWKLAAVLKGHSAESLLDTYEPERRAIAENVIKTTDFTTKVITLRSQLLQLARGYILRFFLWVPPTRRFMISKLMQLLMTYKDVSTALTAEEWSLSFKERVQSAGPSKGDRCPDPLYIDRPKQKKRMFERIQGNLFTVLLFEGKDKTSAQNQQRLCTVARQLTERYKAQVQIALVFSGDERTAASEQRFDGLSGTESASAITILDSNAKIHDAYGAHRSCVYVLRPDRHVGYRGHTPELATDYLDGILFTKSSLSTDYFSQKEPAQATIY